MTDKEWKQSLSLHTVGDWVTNTHCVPTAIAALTGQPIPVVMGHINSLASKDCLQLDQFQGVPPKYWLDALKLMGLRPKVDCHHKGKTIEEFMAASFPPAPILVMAKDEALGVTHVFAVHGNSFVDTYTGGAVQNFKKVPDDMKNFRLLGEVFFT